MPPTHRRYPQEYRQQVVELVRAARTPEELAREFEPSAQTIRNWVKQADLDEGRRHDGVTTTEREELSRLRRENKQLRLEREILARAAAWFARETGRSRPGLRVRQSEPGVLSGGYHVPSAGGLHQRALCVAEAAALSARSRGCDSGAAHPLEPYSFSAYLRVSPHPRRLVRGEGACGPEAGRSPDASTGPARLQPPQGYANHAAAGWSSAGAGPGAAGVQRGRPEPAVGPPSSPPGPGSCIWPRCWTPGAAG